MQQKPVTQEEYQKRINVLVEYVNNHLGEEIDLGMLAEMSGFSPWHFHRITRAFLGEPIGAFVMRMRVETAARLLRYSELPVQDIAYRVGYGVPSSLSKVFRQFYGISPNEYRNNKNYTIMKSLDVRHDLPIEMRVTDGCDKQVIYVRLTGEYGKLDFCAAWKRLWQFVFENRIPVDNPEYLCIYHDDPKVTHPDKLRTDVCLTVDVPVVPKGEVGVKTIKGGKFAIFRYRGPYQNLNAVYDTIYTRLLPEAGLRLGEDTGYENYLNNPEDTAPENLVTEICIPVE